MVNSCCTKTCVSACVSVFCLFLTLVGAVFQAVVGTMNLETCPMQPQLPALLAFAGFSGGLFLLSMLLLSLVGCFCCMGKPQSDSRLRSVIKWCLIGLAIAAVSTTIVLNIYLVYVYQRDFTVVLVNEKDCRVGPCPALGTLRGPNPKLSTDVKHASYCKREFVGAVAFISSPFYVVAVAAGMLIPLIFCVLHLCDSGVSGCHGGGFKELKNEADCESAAGVVPVKGATVSS